MKKLLPLLFIAFCLLGCSSDDDDSKKSSIKGTWIQKSIYAKTIETNDERYTACINDFTVIKNEDKDSFWKYVFNEDGTLILYRLNDDSIGYEGTYTIEDDILTVYIENAEFEKCPIQLSKKTLLMEIDQTEFHQRWLEVIYPDAVVSEAILILKFERVAN